ncbi:hypothetical protein CcCBS67573_g09604, partial [Chytriomyces confervae]
MDVKAVVPTLRPFLAPILNSKLRQMRNKIKGPGAPHVAFPGMCRDTSQALATTPVRPVPPKHQKPDSPKKSTVVDTNTKAVVRAIPFASTLHLHNLMRFMDKNTGLHQVQIILRIVTDHEIMFNVTADGKQLVYLIKPKTVSAKHFIDPTQVSFDYSPNQAIIQYFHNDPGTEEFSYTINLPEPVDSNCISSRSVMQTVERLDTSGHLVQFQQPVAKVKKPTTWTANRMFDTNADSFTTLEHTFVLDSLSCWRAIYPSHIAFAYITGISGIICMITRLHARLYFLHSWFGKVYIIAMLWATGTSLVIHTKGLPTGVIYSFIWVLVGLTLGWFAITLHMKRVFKGGKWYTGRNRFLNACSEMCTLKAFHGCIMFVSWINIAGRIFVTPLTNDFECSTYPAYKNVKSKIFDYKNGSGIQLVPTHDPNYGRAPWANGEQRWAAIMSIGPYVGAFLTIQMFEADSSLTLEYTFVYDSLSCSRDFYWWHI